MIAFCFLLTYSFPMEEVWEKFFEEADDYIIIIHSKPNIRLETEFFNNKSHFVDRIDTKWGDISLVLAQNIMLDYATNKLNADFCCILSGNCIPIKDFKFIKNNLENLPISRFLLTDTYNPVFTKKQSQWCVLSLEHIQIILKYTEKYLKIFRDKNFTKINIIFGAPDEYFYITLLKGQGISNFEINGSTFCDWNLIHGGHPKEFINISKIELLRLRNSHYFFMRKILPMFKIIDNNNLLIEWYDPNKNIVMSKIGIELKELRSL